MKLFKRTKWSNWIDLSTGSFDHHFYLLQGRRSENGEVEFKVRSSGICWYAPAIKLSDLEKLKI